MWWFISGCVLGAFGALLNYWHSHFSAYVTIVGVAVIIYSIFRGLQSSGFNSDSSGSTKDFWFDSSNNTSHHSSSYDSGDSGSDS